MLLQSFSQQIVEAGNHWSGIIIQACCDHGVVIDLKKIDKKKMFTFVLVGCKTKAKASKTLDDKVKFSFYSSDSATVMSNSATEFLCSAVFTN